MIYFKEKNKESFYQSPVSFDKYTPREILQYAIGANMYIPATKKGIVNKIINSDLGEVGSITLCCEDAVSDNSVKEAENNIISMMEELDIHFSNSVEIIKNMPLIFIRVRNVEQFKNLSAKMNKKYLRFIAGFVFPKFSSLNGKEYLLILDKLSKDFDEVLYGMPILEGEELIYKEHRFKELDLISMILSEYHEYILNVRVGGTDFSSRFGLRRSANRSIYDIRVVSDCLIDILNFFLRMERSYVVSGPVWEYFSEDEQSIEVVGLKNEIELDIENGFYGKTIIHPTQIRYVNERYIVKFEEYQDAVNILNAEGGVFKGANNNRMNEVKPHTNWAKKILNRALIFGVLNK